MSGRLRYVTISIKQELLVHRVLNSVPLGAAFIGPQAPLGKEFVRISSGAMT